MDNILIGRELIYEQIKELPEGSKVYIKELSDWGFTKSSPSIKRDDSLIKTKEDYSIYSIRKDMGTLYGKVDVEFYEMCDINESVELTTVEELLSLPDGTYVFAQEQENSYFNSCFCIKQGNKVKALYEADGYDIRNLEVYKVRGTKFYIDKNVKLQNNEEYAMIKAKEVRKIAKEKYSEVIVAQLKNIEKKIIEVANNGELYVYINSKEEIHYQVINELKRNGYKIKSWTNCDSIVYEISWK